MSGLGVIKLIIDKVFKRVIFCACKYNRVERLWIILSKYTEDYSDNFCRFRFVPKYSKAFIQNEIKTSSDYKSLAIVIQGPVIEKDNFTIETVKIYKKIFPGAHIIISSWKNTSLSLISILNDLGCCIVLSDEPNPMGFCHVNYQIKSSFEGIKKARELGAMYCLKNRSDLRINKRYSFEYLTSLLDLFKIKGSEIPLKGRIVTLNATHAQMFYPFWLQDYMHFGFTEDLYKFFDIEYDKRDLPNGKFMLRGENRIRNGKDFVKSEPPEIYLTKSFLKKYIKIEDLSVFDYWESLKRYFIIIDFENLNVIWDKYGLYSMNRFMVEYNGKTEFPDYRHNITFNDFVNLYGDKIKYQEDYETFSERNIFPEVIG